MYAVGRDYLDGDITDERYVKVYFPIAKLELRVGKFVSIKEQCEHNIGMITDIKYGDEKEWVVEINWWEVVDSKNFESYERIGFEISYPPEISHICFCSRATVVDEVSLACVFTWDMM